MKKRLFYHAEESGGQWKKIADENNPFTVINPGTIVRYGKGSTWINKTVDPGSYIGSTGFFGDDPTPNIFKEVQMWVPDSPQSTFNSSSSDFSETINSSSGSWYDETWIKWAGGILGLVLLIFLIKKIVT